MVICAPTSSGKTVLSAYVALIFKTEHQIEQRNKYASYIHTYILTYIHFFLPYILYIQFNFITPSFTTYIHTYIHIKMFIIHTYIFTSYIHTYIHTYIYQSLFSYQAKAGSPRRRCNEKWNRQQEKQCRTKN